MSVAFSLFIVLDNPQETAQVKEFVKEYYADLDCISENVDSSSNEKSVCIESLAIGFFDDSEVSRVFDSIFTGAFVKELAQKEFQIRSMSMLLEGIFIAAADFNAEHIDYCAIAEYDDGRPAVQITGSAKDGFEVKELSYSKAISKEVNNRYFKVMADTY